MQVYRQIVRNMDRYINDSQIVKWTANRYKLSSDVSIYLSIYLTVCLSTCSVFLSCVMVYARALDARAYSSPSGSHDSSIYLSICVSILYVCLSYLSVYLAGLPIFYCSRLEQEKIFILIYEYTFRFLPLNLSVYLSIVNMSTCPIINLSISIDCLYVYQ